MNLEQQTDLVLIRRVKAATPRAKFVIGADFVVGKFTVPIGFTTDLASVPIGMRNLVSQLDGIEAAVLHDYLYNTGLVSRAIADEIFFILLEDLVPAYKRYLMYWGVRLGGWTAYKGEK